MIAVREIRIGDLIQYNNQRWYIRGIEADQLKVGRNGKLEIVSPDDVSPICITEELLLKLGFEESDNDDNPAQPYREFNYHGIVVNMFKLNEPVFLYCADDTFKGCAVSYSRPPLKYLHQLQNLFFVLTGKELDVEY